MACLLMAFIWVGCGDSEPSASFQEAQKIHVQLDRLASELHEELQMAIEEAEAQIQASLNAGDSLLGRQVGGMEGKLGAVKVRVHDWGAGVVALTEAASDHNHEHDHEQGHDRGTGATHEGMSGEANLENQQTLLLELTEMDSLLKEAKSTLQIQDTDGDAE